VCECCLKPPCLFVTAAVESSCRLTGSRPFCSDFPSVGPSPGESLVCVFLQAPAPFPWAPLSEGIHHLTNPSLGGFSTTMWHSAPDVRPPDAVLSLNLLRGLPNSGPASAHPSFTVLSDAPSGARLCPGDRPPWASSSH